MQCKQERSYGLPLLDVGNCRYEELDKFIYSADSYYYLLKNNNNIYAYLFWIKRTRENIATPPLQSYERNQKEKLQLIQAKASQSKVSDILVRKQKGVYLNLNIYNYEFISWYLHSGKVSISVFNGDGWTLN